MASHGQFGDRMSVQTVLPPDYATSAAFRHTAEGLRDLGLWGVEINVEDLEDSRTREIAPIREYLAGFGLKLAMFASGLTAKTLGVSLSAADESRRLRALRAARGMVDWVAADPAGARAGIDERAGIIIGFLKGPVAADPEAAHAGIVASLVELAPYAAEKGVPLILEATNRYETSVVNSIGEGVGIIERVASSVGRERLGLGAPDAGRGAPPGGALLQILPDTFHMNIEEADMTRALSEGFAYYTSFHLSDNNRYFPGFGAIDFGKVLAALRELDYRGRFAIEGNLKGDLLGDLRHSLEYLSPFIG